MCRYIDPHHATWKICENEQLGRYPAVERQDIHLENQQTITFKPDKVLNAVTEPKDTKLTAWFKLNIVDKKAREFTYMEIPQHYRWDTTKKQWIARKKESDRTPCIGRIYTVLRSQGELYFLRLLLISSRGCTSFQDIRTYGGNVYNTYKDVAYAMGLLSDDREIVYALEEVACYGTPGKMRQTFALMIRHSEIARPDKIWNRFKEEMMNDLMYEERKKTMPNLKLDIEKVVNMCLNQIEDILMDMGTSLNAIDLLPNPEPIHNIPKVIARELYDTEFQNNKYENMVKMINRSQEKIFKMVRSNLMSSLPGEQFIVDAPAGYGKTFLFNLLATFTRMMGGICLCLASTGIAAGNMEGGRTAHSTFKLPIPTLEDSVSGIKLQTSEATVIRDAKLILWDEIFNINKLCIEVVERFLRDLMGNNLPFGGKVIVFGGDPRQIPSVVRKGGRAEIVAASFKSSPLYSRITQCELTDNMRVEQGNKEFCDWILNIGNGVTLSTDNEDESMVPIPKDMLLPTLKSLVDETFANLNNMSPAELMDSAIFSTVNEDVWDVNQYCLEKLNGKKKSYLSTDSVEEETTAPVELLNSRKPGGFPDHNLEVKIGCPVMLLVNLSSGLVNGTRMLVRGIHEKVIDCEVFTGTNRGERVFIPRIPMVDRSGEFPWVMTRLQFPLRVCFSMTFHKVTI